MKNALIGLLLLPLYMGCSNSTSSAPIPLPLGGENPKAQPVARLEPFMVRGVPVSSAEFQTTLDDVRTRQLAGQNLRLKTLKLGEFRFMQDGKWAFTGNSADLQVNKNDCQLSNINLEVKATQGHAERVLGVTLSLPYWIQGIAQGTKTIGFTTPGVFSTDGSSLGIGTAPVTLQTEAAFRPVVDITLTQTETVSMVYFDLYSWDPAAKTLVIFARFYTPRGTVDNAVLAYGPSSCQPQQ